MAKDKSKKDGLKKSKKEKFPKGVKLLKGVAFNTFNPEAFHNQLIVAAIEGLAESRMHNSEISEEVMAERLADTAIIIASTVMRKLGYAPPRRMSMSEQVAEGLGRAIENEAFDRK